MIAFETSSRGARDRPLALVMRRILASGAPGVKARGARVGNDSVGPGPSGHGFPCSPAAPVTLSSASTYGLLPSPGGDDVRSAHLALGQQPGVPPRGGCRGTRTDRPRPVGRLRDQGSEAG